MLKNQVNLYLKLFKVWNEPNNRDFKYWYNMPNDFPGIAAHSQIAPR